MGRSRASREDMRATGNIDGMMPRIKKAEGGEVDKWMQDVHPKKGALHREMHIPQDEKIPTSRLKEATHAQSPLERKRANLALRYRGD